MNEIPLFFEFGMLSRNRREGARLAGVRSPDSLADHTARAALIAYCLAVAENTDPLRCAMMALVHDVAECRTTDQHKVAARYIEIEDAERTAFHEQVSGLHKTIQDEWKKFWEEFHTRTTRDGIVTKDADWIEMAIAAREYVCQGFSGMQNWIDNVAAAVETETAKQWVQQINTANPNDWWRDLKKMTYRKL